MYYIIDRFEGDFAVCEIYETKEIVNIEKTKIPEEAKQGDILICLEDNYIIDIEKTEERKQIIHNKIKGLWK